MILALKQITIDAGQSELMEGKYQFYRIYDTQVMTLNGHISTSAVMSRSVKNSRK